MAIFYLSYESVKTNYLKNKFLAANPFLSYTTGKYLPQQAIINASGLLQTTSGATNLATQTGLGTATHLPQQS